MYDLSSVSVNKKEHTNALAELKQSLKDIYQSSFHHFEKDLESRFSDFKKDSFTLVESNRETLVRDHRA